MPIFAPVLREPKLSYLKANFLQTHKEIMTTEQLKDLKARVSALRGYL